MPKDHSRGRGKRGIGYRTPSRRLPGAFRNQIRNTVRNPKGFGQNQK